MKFETRRNLILSLKKHLDGHKRKSTAGSLDYQCEHSECGKTFGTSNQLAKHINIHRNNLQKCLFCPWTGIRRQDASMHNDRHASHAKYKCPNCGKKYYSNQQYQ